MDEGLDEELRRLRARAYGPDADIAADPEALRRLEELETRIHPAPAVDDPPLIDVVPSAAAEPVEATADEPAVEPTEDDVEPAPSRARWVVPVLCIGSAVAAAAVAVSATTAVTFPLTPIAPIVRDGDVRQVATLLVDEDFVWPDVFGGDFGQVQGFQPLEGLRPVYLERGWAGAGTDSCLLVLEDARLDAEAEYFDGQLFWGCGADPFPATVNLRVTPELPDELTRAYGVDASVQFVLDGSRIAVYVAE